MTKVKGKTSFALAALALLGLVLWRLAFARVFEGWFLWDDPRFRAVAPLSLSDLPNWFGTAADDNGYYRPFARLLWSWTTALGATDFSHYQSASFAMLAGATVCLHYVISRLFLNKPIAIAAATGFALSGVHLKTLLWTSVWFHEASCLFAAANLALQIASYHKQNQKLRHLSLLSLFLAYATNNGMHSWALVPIAVDAVFLNKQESESIPNWLKRLAFKSKDHLTLSLALFAFIYVLNDPFVQQRDMVHVFDFGNVKAFALYVASAIAHPWGDGPAYTAYPIWLTGLAALTIAIAALGALLDKKMLIGTATLFGTAIVISLLHGRWQVEYSIPVAMAVAILQGGAVSLAIRKFPIAGWALAPLWMAGCFVVTSEVVAPVFVQSYLTDSKVSKAFVESIIKLDAEEKPGRVFVLTELKGQRLKSAANAHFVHPAVLLYTPGRAFFLDSKLFQTGEDFGMEEASSPFATKVLKDSGPPVKLLCGDYGCEKIGGGP